MPLRGRSLLLRGTLLLVSCGVQLEESTLAVSHHPSHTLLRNKILAPSCSGQVLEGTTGVDGDARDNLARKDCQIWRQIKFGADLAPDETPSIYFLVPIFIVEALWFVYLHKQVYKLLIIKNQHNRYK